MATDAAYDPSTDTGKVRMLLNDTDDADYLFSDAEITAFLTLEPRVRRAAAMAIDTNASNEVLASKVLKTPDVTTDGAKVADALRAHAKALRDRDKEIVDEEDEASNGGVHVTEFNPYGEEYAELAGYPGYYRPGGSWY